MPDKYIDQYYNFSNYSSKCTYCGSDEWKSARLINLDGKSQLSKLCAPPNKPSKPIKLPPKIIRAPLSIVVALLLFSLGSDLLGGLGSVREYLGIPTDSLFVIPLAFAYAIPLLLLFFVLIVLSLEVGFKSNLDFEEENKNYYKRLSEYNIRVMEYPHLRICMRCGKHYMGK